MRWAASYLKTAGLGDVLTRIGDSKPVQFMNKPHVWVPGMIAGLGAGMYAQHRSDKLIKDYEQSVAPKTANMAAVGNIAMAGMIGAGLLDTAKELTKSDATRKKELGIPAKIGALLGATSGKITLGPGKRPSMPGQAETSDAPPESTTPGLKKAGVMRLLRGTSEKLVNSLPLDAASKAKAGLATDAAWLAGGAGTAGLAGYELAKKPEEAAQDQALEEATLARLEEAPVFDAAQIGTRGENPDLFQGTVGMGLKTAADVEALRKTLQAVNDWTWAGAGLGTLGIVGYNAYHAPGEAQRKKRIQDAALKRLETAPILDARQLGETDVRTAEFTVVNQMDDGKYRVKIKAPENPLLSPRPFVGEEIAPSLKLSFRID